MTTQETSNTQNTIEHALQIIRQTRLVAIVRLSDLSQAEALTQALLAGGIRALEFTLTNESACEVVADLRRRIPIFDNGEALIGVGSIRHAAHAQRAVDSGAQFLVSPTLLYDMIEIGQKVGVAAMPGAFTPTEIAAAQQAGASVVKVFPASTLGPGYIRAILAPMPELRLMPTGGVHLGNIADYLRSGVFGIGVGGELVSAAHVAQGRWDEITRIAQNYVNTVRTALP